MPNIRDQEIENVIRRIEPWLNKADAEHIGNVYRASLELTDKIRQAFTRQTGPRLALIAGLDGYVTSWLRLTTFCKEEEPFWMLIRHRVCAGSRHIQDLRKILPYGPLGQGQYDRFYSSRLYSQGFLLSLLKLHIKTFRDHIEKLGHNKLRYHDSRAEVQCPQGLEIGTSPTKVRNELWQKTMPVGH